jgi:hypothetical protein
MNTVSLSFPFMRSSWVSNNHKVCVHIRCLFFSVYLTSLPPSRTLFFFFALFLLFFWTNWPHLHYSRDVSRIGQICLVSSWCGETTAWYVKIEQTGRLAITWMIHPSTPHSSHQIKASLLLLIKLFFLVLFHDITLLLLYVHNLDHARNSDLRLVSTRTYKSVSVFPRHLVLYRANTHTATN